MDYRIEYIDNSSEQVITVPCGIVPNLLFKTEGDYNSGTWQGMCIHVDNFRNMNVLGSSSFHQKANKPFSPYLPDYLPCDLITRMNESDLYFYIWTALYVSEGSASKPTNIKYYHLRVQFRNINQYGVYDGYKYQ